MTAREQRIAARTSPESTDGSSQTADADGAVVAPCGGLTQLGMDVLAFENQRWKYQGAKDTAIREEFDMTPARYYQALDALIGAPGALEADPMLVRRLQRLRALRAAQRAARGVQD